MAAASSDPTDESLKMNVQKRMVFSVRSKMKGVSHRNRSHFSVDYTGKARIGWRMCVLLNWCNYYSMLSNEETP